MIQLPKNIKLTFQRIIGKNYKKTFDNRGNMREYNKVGSDFFLSSNLRIIEWLKPK